MIKACIFDLDGTLANTLHSIAYFGNKALKEFGLLPFETEKYKTMVGNGMDVLVQRMLQIAKPGYPSDLFQKVRQSYSKAYSENYMYLTQAYEGIQPMLAQLKSAGIKLAVLSNKPHNATDGVVRELFGEDVFTCVMGQTEHLPKKPDPAAALIIAQQLDTAPEDILFVGDSNVDVQTGQNAKMQTAGVLWGFRTKEELISQGADYIANTPQDIVDIVLGEKGGA